MHAITKFIALSAFATSTLAQSITFGNTTFTAPVTVGQMFPISFSSGNGNPVSILFGNMTYSFQVVDGLTAPGSFNYRVAVPINVVPGLYQMALLQMGAAPVFSPTFQLVIPPALSSATTNAPTGTVAFPAMSVSPIAGSTTTTTTTVTAIYLPSGTNMTITGAMHLPTVTYIYYDEGCSCHRTSSCASSALPTPMSAMSTTVVTYSAKHCGCTTTVTAPCAPTVIPIAPAPAPTSTPVVPSVAPAPSAPPAAATTSSVPAPAPTTPAPALATYTGGTDRVMGGKFGLAALAAAFIIA